MVDNMFKRSRHLKNVNCYIWDALLNMYLSWEAAFWEAAVGK